MSRPVVYVVTMYRWGNREMHSYLHGVYSTKTKAEKAGDDEKAHRGGNKYYPEVLEVEVNGSHGTHDFKTIVPLTGQVPT